MLLKYFLSNSLKQSYYTAKLTANIDYYELCGYWRDFDLILNT